MAEVRVIQDEKSFSYEGLFSFKGLYKAIMQKLKDLGYEAFEEEHTEQIFEDKKQIHLKLIGDRKLSDFAKVVWEVYVDLTHAQEVVVQKEHQQVKMYQGNVKFKTNVLLMTDYDGSFEQNGFVYFLRVIIDKFVFKSYLNRAQSKAGKDYSIFESTIKSFLNMESHK